MSEAQFQAYMEPQEHLPVETGIRNRAENMTWFEANDYCVNHRRMRLPTEAEWEYAARGLDSLPYSYTASSFNGTLITYRHRVGIISETVTTPAGLSWVGADDMWANIWVWVNPDERDPNSDNFRAPNGITDITLAENQGIGFHCARDAELD